MILDQIASYSFERVKMAREIVSLEEIKERALSIDKGQFCFEEKLKSSSMSFICELKKASPSKGVISKEFPYLTIAKEYEEAKADCISCLTEPKWFLGSDEIFCQIRKNNNLPMLRKDFLVDEYQIYEAKCMGADAVLLICSILDTKTVFKYLQICDELGISGLVETHDEKEIASAVNAGARIIGVNNRNLKDFTVDLFQCERLRKKIPISSIFVAESGIKKSADITLLKNIGADAVLIGECLMLSNDKKTLLEDFRRVAL